MADLGHELTNDELIKLERRINRIYKEASEDAGTMAAEYFRKFEKRDKEMLEMLEAEQITKDQYTQWRLTQISRGEGFEELRDKLAERMTSANEVAISYVNDSTPTIYSLNRNYAAYTIEQATSAADFTLWDERTVRRLIKENPETMPNYPAEKALRRGIDLQYGKQRISASVTSGILRGLSIYGIADDLQATIINMNRASAVRTARTATTGAQNAGRQDTYEAAVEQGIKLKKEWMATLDDRTRVSHAEIDGERVEYDKRFSNGLMFPGDPSGSPAEVYNCRCTMVAVLPETENIPRQTYTQWLKGKGA